MPRRCDVHSQTVPRTVSLGLPTKSGRNIRVETEFLARKYSRRLPEML